MIKDWDKLILEAIRQSRPGWDEPADWRAVLALYDDLSPAEAADLDRNILRMIDEDYRNPYAAQVEQAFDDVLVNLPSGMMPEDLRCIEVGVLVAAERGLGEAYFAFNRLMRSMRWHIMYPRLEWLGREAVNAQRRLASTRAGHFMGAMLGVAVGDALGVTLEFKSREQVRQEYPEGHRDIIGGGAIPREKGQWSDDTDMTLAVARGIAESPSDPVEAVGRHFMSWYNTNPPDVGNTCRLALELFKSTGNWEQTSEEVAQRLGDRAGGNGALMRTVPTALVYGPDTSQALRIARMTHPHPESDAAVRVYHVMVDAVVREGKSPKEAFAAGTQAAGPLASRLEGVASLTENQIRSTGYVVDSLEAALWSFLTTDTLEECVVRAVNLGDDADTVGAIAGGLAGAYYGVSEIPRRWAVAIRDRIQLEEAARQLFETAAEWHATGSA